MDSQFKTKHQSQAYLASNQENGGDLDITQSKHNNNNNNDNNNNNNNSRS